jgi:hypothetical protein
MFFEKFVCIAGRINTDLHDLDRINERIPSQPLDLLLEGGAEQHDLTVGSNVVANRSNLRLETHLEHFVSLKNVNSRSIKVYTLTILAAVNASHFTLRLVQ